MIQELINEFQELTLLGLIVCILAVCLCAYLAFRFEEEKEKIVNHEKEINMGDK